ncbi:TolC family protein [Tepidanaerobacter sp. GT38]|uniref:TolC family protein n=1 Tax=Tepidanaerobacter sp. GT38 TaxID=2722793 RepID=UPI001F1909A1|nr:TolC family protein [Tepidanaerobacter sp. GT38]MCG1013282.1 TolC family protein [Tepidanaerobacter sp. GT38]
MPRTLMSKLLAALLILTLIPASFAFSQEDKKSENEVLKLSLEDAIKLAEENNQQVKLSELGLEKAKLGRQQYRYQDRKAKEQEEELKELGISLEGTFEYDYNTKMADKRTEVAVKLAEAGIDVTVKGIRFGVEAAYYGALSARDNRLLAEAAAQRQQDLLRIAEAKYKAGMVAKTEVLDAQVQLAKAEANLLNAKSQEEKAYINLKKLLGLPQDKPIELTDSFDYKPADFEVTLEELLKEAQKNRIDIMSAQGSYEIAKLDFDLSSKVYPSNTFIYKEKEHAMEEARIKLEDTKAAVEAEVRQIWLDFEEAKANIPVLDKALEMAEESLRLAKLSYEAGLVRSVDVAAAEEGLKQVQLQRAGAIYNYNLARLKLENVVRFSVSGSMAGSSETSSM